MNDDQLNNLKDFIGSELTLIRGEMATKDDLARVRGEMATKDDVADIRGEIATIKDDVASVRAGMATKEELAAVRGEVATIKGDVASMRDEMATKEDIRAIHDRLNENDLKQDEILNAIGEVLDGQSKALHIQASHIDDHERRITHLEKRAA